MQLNQLNVYLKYGNISNNDSNGNNDTKNRINFNNNINNIKLYEHIYTMDINKITENPFTIIKSKKENINCSRGF